MDASMDGSCACMYVCMNGPYAQPTHQEAKFCSWHMATMLAPARKESAGSVSMSHCDHGHGGFWLIDVVSE